MATLHPDLHTFGTKKKVFILASSFILFIINLIILFSLLVMNVWFTNEIGAQTTNVSLIKNNQPEHRVVQGSREIRYLIQKQYA